MIPYKTSRDYTKLKQLLNDGNEIVIFSTLPSGGEMARLLDKPGHRYCSLGSRTKISNNVYVYDIGHLALYSCDLKKKSFESWCGIFDVEFIEPNL